MISKKLVVIAIAALFSVKSFSQGDDKGVRFGLNITPQLDWLRSGDNKKCTSDGVSGKFGFGLSMEFKINDVAHFYTGLGGTFAGGSENYSVGNGAYYVIDRSQNFIKVSDLNKDYNGYTQQPNSYGTTTYQLISRSYKTTYITIPLVLKLMTKEIGALKYFGQFGGNLEILTKARSIDLVQDINLNNSQVTLTDMNVYGDCIPVKAGLNVGIGAEYNLSGSTSLVFGFNYLRAFTTLTQGSSNYMFEGPRPGVNGALPPVNAFPHKIFGDGFALTIGVLF